MKNLTRKLETHSEILTQIYSVMKVKNTLRNINPFVVKYFMNHVALRETLVLLQINAPKSPIATDEKITYIKSDE